MGRITVSVCALALGAAVLAGCSSSGDDADDPRDTSPTANHSDDSPGSSDADGSAGADGSADADASEGSDGSSSDDGGGVEVLPPEDDESGLPGLDDKATGPLISLPLPDQASAEGTLVDGYPEDAVPVAARSRVSTSSVSPAEDRLQVALTATTPIRSSGLLRFYRLYFSDLGFKEKPTTAVGGSEAAAFRRGPDSVVVTATPTRNGTTYTVYGTLHAEQS